MSATELARLEKDLAYAYGRLMHRNATDPTGWAAQAALHREQCGGHDGGVHGTWRFLPWHRGFLYFHERILRHVLRCKNPHFRLPVWDWENNGTVPALYTRWSKLCGKRELRQVPSPTPCVLQGWLLSNDFSRFMGDNNNPGMASWGPHASIHSAVGGSFGSIPDAAKDPLFFAHHANVDRFWALWKSAYTSAPYNPPPGWRSEKFYFFDEHGNAVYLTGGDLLDEPSLGYRYDLPAVPLFEPASTSLGTLGAGGLLTVSAEASQLFARLLDELRQRPNVSLEERVDSGKDLSVTAFHGYPLVLRTKITIQPQTYYIIGIEDVQDPNHKHCALGGFGIFMPPHGNISEVIAILCITLETIKFILERHPRGLQLIYGQADTNLGWTDVPNPFPSATSLNLLHPSDT